MTNLFPLPYWAPALKRVPIPLPLREERWSLINWLSCQRFDFCKQGSVLPPTARTRASAAT